MLKRCLGGLSILLILGAPQVTTLKAHQDAPPAPQKPTAQPPGAAQPGEPPTGRQPQQFVNIRLEITISISDSRGTPVAPPRVVTMYLVDRDAGRLRVGAAANSSARTPDGVPMVTGSGPILNVDATPETLTNSRVRVRLGLEYRPGSLESDKGHSLHVNERVSAVLEDGKPLVVSQTPDPASDRSVKVELKATILK
jgi:hypothetical protein